MSEIVGIGVDMIEISRVLAAYSKESFRKRHFTEEEINILRDPSGRPTVTLFGRAKEKALDLGIDQILLSIADTKEMAIAYATAISSGR